MLMSKIIFKNKKYYFNIFLNKKYFKKIIISTLTRYSYQSLLNYLILSSDVVPSHDMTIRNSWMEANQLEMNCVCKPASQTLLQLAAHDSRVSTCFIWKLIYPPRHGFPVIDIYNSTWASFRYMHYLCISLLILC